MPGAIIWPARYDPVTAPVHVRNELVLPIPRAAAWAKLIRATDWPRWYANAANVRIEGGGDDLTAGARFRWRTFGVNLVTRVLEFVPGERIAWLAHGIGVEAYHAWLIDDAPGGCRILTEETQYGVLSRLGALAMPGRMYKQHQLWLEGFDAG